MFNCCRLSIHWSKFKRWLNPMAFLLLHIWYRNHLRKTVQPIAHGIYDKRNLTSKGMLSPVCGNELLSNTWVSGLLHLAGWTLKSTWCSNSQKSPTLKFTVDKDVSSSTSGRKILIGFSTESLNDLNRPGGPRWLLTDLAMPYNIIYVSYSLKCTVIEMEQPCNTYP